MLIHNGAPQCKETRSPETAAQAIVRLWDEYEHSAGPRACIHGQGPDAGP